MLHPQCVANGRSSSSWAGRGASSGVAASTATNKSREAIGAGSAGGGTEEAWEGTDGEIGGRTR